MDKRLCHSTHRSLTQTTGVNSKQGPLPVKGKCKTEKNTHGFAQKTKGKIGERWVERYPVKAGEKAQQNSTKITSWKSQEKGRVP